MARAAAKPAAAATPYNSNVRFMARDDHPLRPVRVPHCNGKVAIMQADGALSSPPRITGDAPMTQRLPGLSDQDAEGLARDIIAGSNLLLGRTSNLLRILAAHTPYLARWFLVFVAAVRQPNVGAVSNVRLRNLATVKTSMVNACTYCATHTSIYGQDDAYRASPLFDEREKAVIAWSEAVTRNTAKSDEALWDTMRRLFSDAEIVEITLAAAMFNMINRLNDTFWTEIETTEYNRRQANAINGVTRDDIEVFARRFSAADSAAAAE
jgi:alkylhydroperoxidase family enzyme